MILKVNCNSTMLEIIDINKSFYSKSGEESKVLKNINAQFEEKGLYFIVGKSGSGKSTLLNILGGILKPTTGEIKVDGESIDLSDEKKLSEYRKSYISFVFQDFNLIDDFNVKENIQLSGCAEEKEIDNIISMVDLSAKIDTPVRYLSSGEKQRLAIGRALAKNSNIMLLDEPTGNLDSKNAETVFKIIKKISLDKLVIVVSHDRESVDKYGDYKYEINDGRISICSDLNRPCLHIDEFSEESDSAFEIYKVLVTNDIAKIIVISHGQTKEIVLNEDNLFKQVKIGLSEFEKKDIDIIFCKKRDYIDPVNFNEKNRFLAFLFLVK